MVLGVGGDGRHLGLGAQVVGEDHALLLHDARWRDAEAPLQIFDLAGLDQPHLLVVLLGERPDLTYSPRHRAADL